MLDLLPNELSCTDKEILYLRYQLNLNCVDIAEYLHISHEASRARLSRRQTALRPPACEGTADVSPAKYLCCVYYAAAELHDKGKVSRFRLTFPLYIILLALLLLFPRGFDKPL